MGGLVGARPGKALLGNGQEAPPQLATEESTTGEGLTWETGGQVRRRGREACAAVTGLLSRARGSCPRAVKSRAGLRNQG